MPENLIEAQYDVTKKSKFKKFYDKYKILIFSTILILIFALGTYNFYLAKSEKRRVLLSENYIQAKIYLENGKKIEAINILKSVIFANDSTYSPLCFFMILNQDLISDFKEISILFEHLLENNKFDKEIRNLLVYKKALFDSNFVNESELLKGMKPLLSTQESLWKPHALLLLGDYFLSKGEYLKAREFYIQILTISNLHKDLYYQAKSQLEFIAND